MPSISYQHFFRTSFAIALFSWAFAVSAAPTINASDTTGNVTDPGDGSTGSKNTNGTINFSNVATVSTTFSGPSGLGTFSLGTLDNTADTQAWSYSANHSAIRFLGTGESQVETYTIRLTDDGDSSFTEVDVNITIFGANDQPVAADVGINAVENGPDVNGNFSETDADTNDTHTFNITSSPAEGSVTNNNNGTFTFSPGADFQDLAVGESRNVSFTYTATDNSGAGNATSTAKTVTVTVAGANDQPVAADVGINAVENGPDVNGNFSETDADTNDTHTFNITSSPAEGSVTNNNNGTFTFSPGADFQDLAVGESRNVSFTYTATDNSGAGNATSTAKTVTVTVAGANDQPVAADVGINAVENGPDVNGNFSETDADTNDTHTFNITSSPAEGSVTNNNNGTFTFSPGADFQDLAVGESRNVSFTYTATDNSGAGNATSTAKTVTVTVAGANDQPVAADVGINAVENGPDVNGNFSETDADTNDTHTFNITSSPAEGSVTNNNNGTFTFSPGTDFQDLAVGENRIVSFTYTATDSSGAGNATSTAKTVSVTVAGANDQPVAADVGINAVENGPDVNGNFSETDADTNDTHTFNITSSPAEGSVTNNNNGTFTFSPGADFQDLAVGENRIVSFTYTATDNSGAGNATSTAKTVTVTVAGANDQPVAADVAINAVENGPDVNGNFSETDADTNDTHTFNITSSPTEGSVTNNNNGTFTFSPGTDFQDLAVGENRIVSFTYTATDNSGAGNATSTAKTVTVTVAGANDQPVAADVAINAVENGPDVNGNFSETDADTNDTHTFNITSSPTEGSVTNNNNGTFTFSPGTDFQDLAVGENRIVSFTYTATDNSGAGNATSTAKTVTVTVAGANDQPVAADVAINAVENGPDVNGNFSETDADTNDTHTFNITSSPTEGSVTNNNNGTFTFSPGTDFQDLAVGENRNVSFTYTATDNSGAGNATSTAKTVTVTVAGANDQPVAADVAINAVENGPDVNGNFSETDADTNDTHTFNITSSPTEGSVTNNNDGTFTFSPGAAFQDLAVGETRDVTFTYTAKDDSGAGNATSTAKTVTVTVAGANDVPVLTVSDLNAAEDGLAVGSIATFTDADTTDVMSYSISAAPIEGSATINAVTGRYSFNPGAGFQRLGAGETTTVTFDVTVDDGNSGTDTKTATVTITGVNDAATVAAVSSTDNEDAAGFTMTVADLLANSNETIDLSDTLRVANVSLASGDASGVTVNGDGSLTVNPGAYNALAAGESEVIVYNFDAQEIATVGAVVANSQATTATITITGVNDVPVLTVNDLSAAEDGPAVGSIASFTDADTTDVMSYSISAAPAEGSAVIDAATGRYGFNPGAEFQRLGAGETTTVTFDVTVDDGNSGTDTKTVTVTITGVNDAATVAAVTSTATEDAAAFTLTVADLLANSNETVDISDTLGVANVTLGSGDASGITVNGDGSLTVDPNAYNALATGESEVIVYNYDVQEIAIANGLPSNTQPTTVTITITGVNDAPVIAAPDTGAVTEITDGAPGENVDILSATGILSYSDSDASNTHTVSNVTETVSGQGSAEVPAALGTLTTVLDDAADTITWTYKVADADIDPASVGAPRIETFELTLDDGNGGTDITTVTITINGSNDKPVLGTITSVTGSVTEITDGDAGEDTDNLEATGSFGVLDVDALDDQTASVTVTPVGGDLDAGSYLGGLSTNVTQGGAGNALIEWSYIVNDAALAFLGAGESVSQTYTIAVSDGIASIAQTVAITINGANDGPVLPDQTVTLPENSLAPTTVIDALGTIDDDASDTFTYEILDINPTTNVLTPEFVVFPTGDSKDGTLQVGSYPEDTEILNFEENSTFIVQIQVTDSQNASSTGLVTVNLSDVNDPPGETYCSDGVTFEQDLELLQTNGIYDFTADSCRRVVRLSLDYTMDQGYKLTGTLNQLPDDDTAKINYGPSLLDGNGGIEVLDQDLTASTLYFTELLEIPGVFDKLTLDPSGSFEFTPPVGTTDDQIFIYRVCDEELATAESNCAIGIVNILITPAPLAQINTETDEDGTVLSHGPLELPISAPPNVMVLLDDSREQGAGVVTEESDGFYTYQVTNAKGNKTSDITGNHVLPSSSYNSNFYLPSEANTPGKGLWRTRNSDFNKIYYNPDVLYKPWAGANAKDNEYPQADPSAAFTDPYAEKTPIDLLNDEPLEAGLYLPHYYLWKDTNGNTLIDEDVSDGLLVEIKDVYSGAAVFPDPTDASRLKSESRTDCAADRCTYAEEIQNFANYYTYYSTRMKTYKAAVSQVLAGVDNMRIGYAGFTGSNGAIEVKLIEDEIDLSRDATSGALLLALSNKEELIKNMTSTNISQNATKIYSALENTGNYFENNNGASIVPSSSDPIIASCQQNFALVVSSGIGDTNDSATNGFPDADFDDDTVWDNLIFADNQPFTTLADIAMHFYERDLSDLLDEVPAGEKDKLGAPAGSFGGSELTPTMHQHMKTFVIAFGVDGSISEESVYFKTVGGVVSRRSYDEAFDWTPLADEADPNSELDIATETGKLNDLVHTAVNGRGDYLSAGDPEELEAALNEAFTAFRQAVGTASAVSFNSQEIQEGSLVFRSFYNILDNTGDLVAQEFEDNGALGATVWSASANLDCFGATLTQSAEGVFSCPDSYTFVEDYNQGARSILTMDSTTSVGIPFRDTSLTAAQKATLSADADEVTDMVNYLRGDATNEDQEDPASRKFRERPVVEGRLGDIVSSTPVFYGAPNRPRRNSPPYPIDDATGLGTYETFKSTYASRQEMVYVGANDGMLHGFNATNGTEVFAYVPSLLLTGEYSETLDQLTDPFYSHRFSLDLPAAVNDAYLDTDRRAGESATVDWATILIGGYRAGAKGYFALDITDPTGGITSGKALTEANAANVVLWEFTDDDAVLDQISGTDDDRVGSQTRDYLTAADFGDKTKGTTDDPLYTGKKISNLGYSYSSPTIAMSNVSGFKDYLVSNTEDESNRWVAVFGNGYDSSSGNAVFYAVFIDGGTDGEWCHPNKTGCSETAYDFIEIEVAGRSSNGVANGLGEPRGIDVDGNGTIDYAYAGDRFGNMYRFDLRRDDPAEWTHSLLFRAAYKPGTADEKVQPISTQPLAVVHPTRLTDANCSTEYDATAGAFTTVPCGGFIITFGTGTYLFEGDDQDEDIQSLYGIWDLLDNAPTVTDAELVTQDFVAFNEPEPIGAGRTITENPVNYLTTTAEASQKKGWRLDFDHPTAEFEAGTSIDGSPQFAGEKAIRNIQIRGGIVFVNSVIPKEVGSCSVVAGGAANAYCPDTGNLTCIEGSVFDVNEDGTVDDNDKTSTGGIVASTFFEDSVPTDSTFIGNDRVTQLSDLTLEVRATDTGNSDNTGRISWTRLNEN